MDQPGKVANRLCGQLDREKYVRAREFGLARQVRLPRPASAYSFSSLRLNLVLTHGIPPAFRDGVHLFLPPTAIGTVPTLSGYAIAYRWRSLPRVRRHRASSPRGSSSNECCICRYHQGPITMRLSFSHTHYVCMVTHVARV